jgi:hypothetical protein
MAVQDWEDLDAFLDLEEFAASVTLGLQDGGSRELIGIFDDPYLNAELGEYELDTTRPRLTCKAADVTDVRRRDTVTINGETMDVMTDPQPDGTGLAVLALARRHG